MCFTIVCPKVVLSANVLIFAKNFKYRGIIQKKKKTEDDTTLMWFSIAIFTGTV